MTYQIIITEEVANVAVTSESYPIIIEYNATNMSANATYGNTEVAAYLASGTNTSVIYNIGNIITDGSMVASGIVFATGNVTGGNIRTAGQVSATGNVQGAYILGDGSQLTGLPVQPGTYGNANVAANLAAFGSNPISTSGNVTAGYVVGNGSLLTNLTGANVTGTVANATYALNANASTFAGTVTTAAQPNITSVGILSSLSASGNITGNYFIGNGSQLTDLPVQPGTYGNANVSNFLANGFGSNTITTTGNITSGNSTVTTTLLVSNIQGAAGQNVTVTADGTGDIHLDADSVRIGDNNQPATLTTHGTGNLILRTHEGSAVEGNITIVNGANGNIQLNPNGTGVVTTTIVSASGNVTGANLVATANLTSTQQTVIGTANVGTTGNIVISGKNIATDMAWSPDGGNAATAATGRVVVGTGWNGNISHNATQSRLSPTDSISRTNTSTSVRQFNAESLVTMNGNATNGSFRQQAVGTQLRIGGGSAANTVALTNGAASVFAVAAGQFNLEIGNVSPYNLGNTTISHAVINGGAIQPAIGSTVTNAFGLNCLIGAPTGTSIGNVTNYTGYSTTFAGAAGTGNIFMFYNGNATSASARNVTVNNTARSATNYYFLMNEDDVAQNQLGSLRRYHEFNGVSATTSGSLTIDKTAGQVQQVNLAGNITSVAFSNFVSSASDSVNTDEQCDTVTIAFNQGATGGYGVTFPTGSEYKYAGNVRALQSTAANSVSLVSVSALRLSGTTTYLITFSPGFVS